MALYLCMFYSLFVRLILANENMNVKELATFSCVAGSFFRLDRQQTLKITVRIHPPWVACERGVIIHDARGVQFPSLRLSQLWGFQ